MSTATAVRVKDFPRVNLLPAEIAEEQRFRTIRAVMALAVVAAVAGVGGLWYLAHNQVTTAEEALATQQALNANLVAEQAKYADVPVVYAAVAAAQSDLNLAMGQEVRYSFVLNDLSLTIPSNVWLTSLVVTQDVDSTTPVVSPLGTPGIGTMTVQGVAFKQNNVASWLSSLNKSDYYADPYFSSSTDAEPIDGQPLVDYDSSVTITDQAYSNRYTTGG